MYQTLLYQTQNNITTITLNRPEVYNAFNTLMSTELQDALKKAHTDTQTRCIILTGAGKAFCSGQDLKDRLMQNQDTPNTKANLGDSLHKRYNPIIRAIRNMPKPVICALNGVGAGAGCSIALACDVIIASEKATLVEVFINVALVLDSGSSYFLPRTVGYHKAFELATKGSKITAAQAQQLGFVSQVVAPDALEQATLTEATYYANAPTKAIALMKKLLTIGQEQPLNQVLDYEAYAQEIAGYTQDNTEGVQAFIEKRPPVFTGN
jgi:2-(1,2-epoxy-1,2-dihydrophenyl)acetyl-CoA isomerase